MKLTTSKLPNYGSEKRHFILRQGTPVGILSKLPNTRTDENPWKLFLYKEHFVPGKTDVRLVTVAYGKSFGEARRELLRIATDEVEREIADRRTARYLAVSKGQRR